MINMNEMTVLVELCSAEIKAILPANEFTSLSRKTRKEYRQLGRKLLSLSRVADGGLVEVVNATQRPSTFYKRLAALRYCLYAEVVEQLEGYRTLLSNFVVASQPVTWSQLSIIYDQLQQLRASLREFHMLRKGGQIGARRKRASKRQALLGLPSDWREQLYVRGAKGKYADAMLVAALTGCRPEELRRGVVLRRGDDSVNGLSEISFEIKGAKVKLDQGQPRRVITYGCCDSHPLLVAMRARLAEQHELLVCIENPVNFTVEIRRLARSLWPKQKLPITAYCLRHQWSADMKRCGDADSVSQGLGHVSAKTRRHYGLASQANSGHVLQPISIEAERPVRPTVGHRPGEQATSELNL